MTTTFENYVPTPITDEMVDDYIVDRDVWSQQEENDPWWPNLTVEQKQEWNNLTLEQKQEKARTILEYDRDHGGDCHECQSNDIEEVNGFPGETIFRCRRCGHAWSTFDESAIV